MAIELSRRAAALARPRLIRDVETVASVRAAEPEFAALFDRVCAAGTDDKWWFGRAYELVGGLALLQNPEEITALCLLLRRHAPRETYLEIGSAGGGTCRFLHQEVGLGRVLSIDDGAHPRAAEQDANFAAVGDVTRFVGDSHGPDAAAFLAEHVPGRDLDIAFVDGDHSWRGVRQDVELVLPYCRPGALLILHDTRECTGVEATWLELAARRRIEPLAELVGAERPMGIGVGRVRG
ncbi:MAG: class I SAM-dependent methyltransferase [Solirubrobacteraceae bacterium]